MGLHENVKWNPRFNSDGIEFYEYLLSGLRLCRQSSIDDQEKESKG